ncbi:MAG: oligosaccharide flippase family protein [Nanoarchaeota archaeon]|nr:oligosaccharide flippase family protein [Nanoarchaeota archaeon]MBU1252507.1 oligosaccharide flippase family protein [Nanoarchaeota archaeon]MBU1501365.1 oligosaccharide flippase family protein [Nanoarchaeota archaeon]MBU2458790.1 oligosaccharide flippase family protein [Nanoarchaeota archaeon]
MEQEIENQNLSKIAVKNSKYIVASTLIFKFGGLIFTILIARLLLPELFGIYALVLSIVTIFSTFTNMGLDETFLRYFSEALGKNNHPKARSYFRHLLKIKAGLVVLTILILLLTSKFLSYKIYDNPLLFYPLIFSCLFILMESFKGFISSVFIATKNVKPLPLLELLHQIFKISFSVLAILVLSQEFRVAGLFFGAALAGFIHLFLLVLILYKKNKNLIVGETETIDKKRVNRYLGFAGLTTVSLVFFGSIDTLMLGKFVESSYLGYYRIALSLILTIISLLSLSSVFLPIFTQIHGKRFERGFQKTLRFLMILAIPATVGIIFIAKHLILIIYGNEYLLATSTLYFLALLIVTAPLITLYTIIFESKEKPKIVSKSVFISLIINIVLNYILITYLLNFGQEYAIIGAGVSTVISRLILMGILITNAKNEFNLSIKGIGLRKPILATFMMALFLLTFNHFVDMNLFFGILEIILGAGIYFGVLLLIKGIGREDLEIIKNLVPYQYFSRFIK